jgi:glyceraldehyde 3-phosphate dehydrogenase
MANPDAIPSTSHHVTPTRRRTRRPHRIAINGAGRIGRLLIRQIVDEQNPNVQIVALVGPAAPSADADERMRVLADYGDNIARLLRHDSVHGRWAHDVDVQVDAAGVYLVIDGPLRIALILREKTPSLLPWAALSIDILAETSGAHARADLAREHLQAGARYVVLGAPGKAGNDGSTFDGAYVYGVNHRYLSSDQRLISNASCTTNCTAPIVHVMKQFGMQSGVVVTTHSVTGSQPVLDRADAKNPERGMAAFANIIDTSTGVARALREVDPTVACEFTASAFRAPTLDGSLISATFTLSQAVTRQQVIDALATAAKGELAGVLELRKVDWSGQIVGERTISIVAPDSVVAMPAGDGGTLVTLQAWYDNEAGYANQLVRMLEEVAVVSEEGRAVQEKPPAPRTCSIKLNPTLNLADLPAAAEPASPPAEKQPARTIRLALHVADEVGRAILRQLVGHPACAPAVIMSDDPASLIESIRWDARYGRLDAGIEPTEKVVCINGREIALARHPFDVGDMAASLWDRHAVDIVIDVARTPARVKQYQTCTLSSAQRAIVGLPALAIDGSQACPIPLRTPGVSDHSYTGNPSILWYPSTTTHALSPVLSVLLDHWRVEAASFASVRATGSDQCLDGGDILHGTPGRMPRNTRLTPAQANREIGQTCPTLKDRIRGDDIWVDAPGGSVISLVALLAGPTTPDDVNDILLRAARRQWHGIIAMDERIDTSIQVVGRDEAGVVASRATRVISLPGDRSLVKLHIWHDEVWGYGRGLLRMAQEAGMGIF